MFLEKLRREKLVQNVWLNIDLIKVEWHIQTQLNDILIWLQASCYTVTFFPLVS